MASKFKKQKQKNKQTNKRANEESHLHVPGTEAGRERGPSGTRRRGAVFRLEAAELLRRAEPGGGGGGGARGGQGTGAGPGGHVGSEACPPRRFPGLKLTEVALLCRQPDADNHELLGQGQELLDRGLATESSGHRHGRGHGHRKGHCERTPAFGYVSRPLGQGTQS